MKIVNPCKSKAPPALTMLDIDKGQVFRRIGSKYSSNELFMRVWSISCSSEVKYVKLTEPIIDRLTGGTYSISKSRIRDDPHKFLVEVVNANLCIDE